MKRIVVMLTLAAVIFSFGLANAQGTSSSYDTAAAPVEKPTSGYAGGFFIGSPDGDYKITVGGRLDTMFFWQSNKAYIDTTGTINDGSDDLTFRVRRAQIWVTPSYKDLGLFLLIGTGVPGSTYWVATGSYEFGYGVGIDWGTIDPFYDLLSMTSSKRTTYVDNPIVLTQQDGEQPVWAGLDLQSGTAIGDAALSIARPSFGLPTQLGIQLRGSHLNNRLSWGIAVGNGNESTDTLNQNRQFTYAMRIEGTPIGKSCTGDLTDLRYDETPSLTFGLGGAFEHDDTKVTTGPFTGQKAYNWSLDGTADVAFKYRGFSANVIGYYRQIKVGPAAVIEQGENYLTDVGYLATLAMFAIPKKLEFHAWGSQIIREGPDNDVFEYGGGVNYYFKGHNSKLQLDFSRVGDYDNVQGQGAENHNRIRAKMQVYF